MQLGGARHVDVAGVAAAEGPRLDELEMERLRQLCEDRHSLAKGGGLDVEPVLVDQALADERAGKSGAAIGDDVAAGLRLDALDFLDQVPAGDARLRPLSPLEGLREDDLSECRSSARHIRCQTRASGLPCPGM